MKPELKILFNSNIKIWYLDGQRHRENGPAVEYPSGIKLWYLNGKKLSEEQLLSEELKIDYPELYNSYLVYYIMGS